MIKGRVAKCMSYENNCHDCKCHDGLSLLVALLAEFVTHSRLLLTVMSQFNAELLLFHTVIRSLQRCFSFDNASLLLLES